MDSRVHGNLPCDMCGEENMKRIPLDRKEWDIYEADDYNSLFDPCVAEFRAGIGRPINRDLDGGVVATSGKLQATATMPGGSDSMATPPVDNKIAAALAKSTDTAAPHKNKPRTLQPMVLFPPKAEASPPVDNKSAAAVAKSTDTSTPQKKKPRTIETIQPRAGEEKITCSCATCLGIQAHIQKMKSGGYVWDK